MAALTGRHIHMKYIAEFVKEHLDDEISRLILNKEKWPDIDMDIPVNCKGSLKVKCSSGTTIRGLYFL